MFDFLTGRLRQRPQAVIERYLDGLSRESLRSGFRTELLRLDGYKPLALLTELRKASERNGRFYELFLRYSTETGQPGCRVWTSSQFTAFLAIRLQDDELNAKVAPILWRCFCFTATYPFTNAAIPPENQTVDLDGWVQATILLFTNAIGVAGKDWERYGVKFALGRERRDALRRSSNRLHFVSFASQSHDDDSVSMPKLSSEQHDFDTQEAISEVAKVARAGIPLPRKDNTPNLENLRPRVQQLFEGLKPATETATITYDGFQALIELILRIQYAKHEADPPTFSLESYPETQRAIASAILHAFGMSPGREITFEDYMAFTSKQPSSFSFDSQIAAMWQALFALETPQHQTADSAEKHPPSYVLQAVDFMLPWHEPLVWRQERRQSLQSCSTNVSDGLSYDDVLRALTSSFGPKLLILHGIIEPPSSNSSDSAHAGSQDQPAAFAVLLCTSLWSAFNLRNGVAGFRVGDRHALMSLAPHARVLRPASQQTRIEDLVETAHNKILFGASPSGLGTNYVSGLEMDFGTGMAALRYRSAPKEETISSYVEFNTGMIDVGTHSNSAEEISDAQPWEIVASIQKIEVYSFPKGIPSEMIIHEDDGEEKEM